MLKNYYEVQENDQRITHIKTEVYYSKGAYNGFTSNQEKRGYYLSILPVECTGYSERYEAFMGFKLLLKEVTRKSKKAEQAAEQAAEQCEMFYVNILLDNLDLKLKEGDL